MDRETKERLKNQILYHRPLTNEEMGIKPGQESQILQISLSITALAYSRENDLKFSGSRVKRGLYRSSNGTLVNADINGASNIGRKVIQNSEFLGQLDRSLAARPVRINPLKVSA